MPLAKYQCSICGALAPKRLLQEGRGEERLAWLRRHYKRKHPRAFRAWYGKSRAIKQTKTRKSLNRRKRRIGRR